MKKETLINFKPTFATVAIFFDEWNREFPRMADPRRLKGTTRAVAECCIRLYGRQLSKAGKILVNPSELGHCLDFADDFSTNCAVIAKEVNYSKRTVHAHLTKLLDANFFTNKRNHGPIRNFDLRFNKKILSIRTIDDVENARADLIALIDEAKAETGIQYFQKDELQNSPQLHSTRNKYKDDNILLDVVKKSNSDEFVPEQETTGNNNGDKGKEREIKRGSQETDQLISPEVEKKIQKAPARLKKSKQVEQNIRQFALELWLVAANLIWSDWEFGPKQLEAFKTMLLPYFEPAKNTAEAKKYYNNYAKRLEIAAKYYEKHPDFDKVHPFTYFDPSFQYGFSRTKAWYIKQRAKEYEFLKTGALRKALKYYQQHKNLKAYQRMEKELQQFKDPVILRMFHHAVAENKSAAAVTNNFKNRTKTQTKWHSTTQRQATKH